MTDGVPLHLGVAFEFLPTDGALLLRVLSQLCLQVHLCVGGVGSLADQMSVGE